MKKDSTQPTSNAGSPGGDDPNFSFRLPTWVKILLLAAVVALVSAGYYASILRNPFSTEPLGTIEADPDEVARRQVLDDFILTDADGTQKKLSDYRGNIVILSFWASWCGPCLVELPTFAEMERTYRDSGLRIIAVNVDEGDAGVQFAKEFWPKKDLQFPSFFDTNKDLASRFEVDRLPSNFVIDRKGRLALESSGAMDWSSPQALELIKSLLQEIETSEDALVESPGTDDTI